MKGSGSSSCEAKAALGLRTCALGRRRRQEQQKAAAPPHGLLEAARGRPAPRPPPGRPAPRPPRGRPRRSPHQRQSGRRGGRGRHALTARPSRTPHMHSQSCHGCMHACMHSRMPRHSMAPLAACQHGCVQDIPTPRLRRGRDAGDGASRGASHGPGRWLHEDTPDQRCPHMQSHISFICLF